MGIRGAWSLLSNDPRRFGESWACTADESIIWIDGPALTYYLALQPKFEQLRCFHGHHNQHGQASPASIYRRTKNFITVLSNLAKEVHVVMDGLGPSSKVATQVARMKVAAEQADMAARSSSLPRNCKVISILAEWTMVETIENMCPQFPNLSLYRPANGEAEAYIDAKLGHGKDNAGVVILSNDTDFLVYDNCPGFMPFCSLQFTPSSQGTFTLAGFHYLSCHFRRAFFQNRQDDRLLSTVAGLAGCDYEDKKLASARVLILKSKVGGLRVKHQNKPTSQMTLTAVLRYVGHYLQHDTPWLDALVHSLGDTTLSASLIQVHQTYFPGTQPLEDGSFSVESMRLVHGVFFCRPLIEKWASSSGRYRTDVPIKVHRGHHRSKKSRKRQKSIGAVNTLADENYNHHSGPTAETVDFDDQLLFDYTEVCNQLLKQSVWTLPAFQRFRLLCFAFVVKSAGRCNSLHLTEWRRDGGSQGLDYKEFYVMLPPAEVVTAYDYTLRNSNMANSRPGSIVHIAASLLPSAIVWLWFLLLSAPPAFTSAFSELKRDLDQNVMNLLSVACFHAYLANEVMSACQEGNQKNRMPVHYLGRLDNEFGGWIWSVINDVDSARLPYGFFETTELTGNPLRDEWYFNLNAFISAM